MAEHHAISRRAFTLGLGLAALSPFASLPETAAPGIPLRAAFADNTPAPSDSLDNFVIRLRPAGYFRTASVNQDGNVRGNVCHLFNDGTSSKLILENVTTKNDDTNWYAIRTLLNFEESIKRRATAFGRSTTTRTKMERSSTYGAASMTTSPAALLRSNVNQTEPISFETARSRKKPRKKTLSTWQ